MCTKCNQNSNCGCNENAYTEVHICNQCPPEQPCDCPVKDLSTDCSLYNQDDIKCGEVNVVPKNTILSVALQNIVNFVCTSLEEIKKYFQIINTGVGSSIYSGDNLLGQKKLRKINSSSILTTVTENTNDISIGIDATNLINFIQTNQKTYSENNVGTGVQVFKNSTTSGNNTQFNLRTLKVDNQLGSGSSIIRDITQNTDDITVRAKKIKSSSLMVTEDDLNVFLEVPNQDFNYLKSFYVNSNFIPTITSPSDGSIIRPFVNFDEARLAVIGTGSVDLPQFLNAVIILQTSSSTNQNPTVNTLTIRAENYSVLTYTGTDLYMFDTEVIYPLVPKNTPRQDLTRNIIMTLTGKGVFTRTNGVGLVRGMGANRNGLGILTDYDSAIKLGINNDDDLSFIERSAYPNTIWDGDITNSSNVTLESFYGFPHKYSLQLNPTNPLIHTQYKSAKPQGWGIECRGSIYIQTLANTAIRVEGDTLLYAPEGNIKLGTNGQYISTVSATKMVDFPNSYQPKANKNFIECNYGSLYCKNLIIDDISGYQTTGVDNFFKITNNGNFSYGAMSIDCPYYVNKFINTNDISNTLTGFSICNNTKGSEVKLTKGRYFLDVNQSSFSIGMVKSIIYPFLNKATTSVNILPSTNGTFASLFGKPVISDVDSFSNNTTAILGGLTTNGIYYNTTNNSLDIV